ncbi:DoxX family protein [Pedobacter sp. JY14-1]|uniref:DoxX family protein n=1 Tax=Pedobacter sp. JY14-1 TaxID=3034151 RepID=UPI0023E1C6CE|nr:DoxX family protein [Pedobacter sp. JY14-1]
MRKLFNTNFNNESVHFMLLVLRVSIGAFMAIHGFQKLQWVLAGGEVQFGDPIGLGPAVSLYLTIFAEFFCSILLILGLATRLALIPLIVTMLVAVLVVHAPDGFDKKELGLHFLAVFLFLLVSGPGRFSIDTAIGKNASRRRR